MKLGVLSDTHDQRVNILKAVDILNAHKVELVIHCGDWVSPFTLKYYDGLRCPIKGIFGNNDGDKFRHTQRAADAKAKIAYEERFLSLTLDGRKIAAFHGDYREITDALITCGKYDAVFHGHNHTAENKMVGKTLSLNPGTLIDDTSDTTKGASLAIYETKDNSAQIISV
jgi:putative phosphoesterase